MIRGVLCSSLGFVCLDFWFRLGHLRYCKVVAYFYFFVCWLLALYRHREYTCLAVPIYARKVGREVLRYFYPLDKVAS